jgi:hypothetical protein
VKHILLDYVLEAGWPVLPPAEQKRWLGAYRAYVEAMSKAGVLRTGSGLQPSSAATTVRILERSDNPILQEFIDGRPREAQP